MAIAEASWPQRFNRPGHAIVDHYTYAIVSDGDLMEGVASEAASLAGHCELGKLIYLYDDNDISLDGPTSLAFTEDRLKRFDAYGRAVLSRWKTATTCWRSSWSGDRAGQFHRGAAGGRPQPAPRQHSGRPYHVVVWRSGRPRSAARAARLGPRGDGGQPGRGADVGATSTSATPASRATSIAESYRLPGEKLIQYRTTVEGEVRLDGCQITGSVNLRGSRLLVGLLDRRVAIHWRPRLFGPRSRARSSSTAGDRRQGMAGLTPFRFG